MKYPGQLIANQGGEGALHDPADDEFCQRQDHQQQDGQQHDEGVVHGVDGTADGSRRHLVLGSLVVPQVDQQEGEPSERQGDTSRKRVPDVDDVHRAEDEAGTDALWPRPLLSACPEHHLFPQRQLEPEVVETVLGGRLIVEHTLKFGVLHERAELEHRVDAKPPCRRNREVGGQEEGEELGEQADY